MDLIPSTFGGFFLSEQHSLAKPPLCWGSAIILIHFALGRTPPDKLSARRTDLYLTTYNTHKRQTYSRRNSNPHSQRAATDPRLRVRGQWDRPTFHWPILCSVNCILSYHFSIIKITLFFFIEFLTGQIMCYVKMRKEKKFRNLS